MLHPVRGVWVEIGYGDGSGSGYGVAPREGCVSRNFQ